MSVYLRHMAEFRSLLASSAAQFQATRPGFTHESSSMRLLGDRFCTAVLSTMSASVPMMTVRQGDSMGAVNVDGVS